MAEPSEIALRRIALWQRRLRKGVTQVCAEVEAATFGDAERVGDRLREVRKKARHF